MSVFRKSGLVKKRTSLFHLLIDQLKLVDLKPVTRIAYKFDPFFERTKEFRDCMHYFSARKIRETNPNCTFKTEVVCDNTEPEIACKLIDGRTLTFKAGNLTSLQILQHFNRIVLPLVPAQEVAPVVTKTKSQKKK